MFKRSVSRTAALSALASLAAAATVSAAPVPFGGNTYDVVFDEDITWTEARGAAATAGGELAVISSAEEQSFVESLLLNNDAPTGSYWFGIQETATEGEYEAVNGEALMFTNFAPGEPNDGQRAFDGTGENVGGIYWTADGGDVATLPRRGSWNDLPEEGYPNDNDPLPTQADLRRAGYLIELAGIDGGDGDGDGDGGGGATPIPIPAAALAFPGTALVAYFASRRMRRGR